ncbi:hypothetical protein [Chryseobacterium sp. MA9]|uniref:hypothetical protein n=1 Tax=Chryseobacterium sp. MA9 TaxID=2966625 RepID=UPI00210740FA|nr:hypothetical protein [Chryseobacterium sp. MA9]UTX48830.1 hypothetical protein KIK00_00750 [Chryseobacterium sp. MA9]
MTGKVSKDQSLSVVKKIFNRHQALFIDIIGGEIRPTIFDDHLEDNTMETFQAFYSYNTTYDMTFKWITEKGPFKYEYQWLTTKYSNEEKMIWKLRLITVKIQQTIHLEGQTYQLKKVMICQTIQQKILNIDTLILMVR